MTSTTTSANARADALAARVTGVGIGLVVFMIAWTVGARITDHLWGPPSGALVAMGTALLAGSVTALVTGGRLAKPAGSPVRVDEEGG